MNQNTTRIGDVFVNPAQPNELYVTASWNETTAGAPPHASLFKSTDGGMTWAGQPVISPPKYNNNTFQYKPANVGRAAMNTQGTAIVVFHGCNGGGQPCAYVTRDGGKSWDYTDPQGIWNWTTSTYSPTSVEYSWNNPNYWYISMRGDNTNYQNRYGVLYSKEDGKSGTWHFIPAPAEMQNTGLAMCELTVDRDVPTSLMVFSTGSTAGTKGIYYSPDGGSNWTRNADINSTNNVKARTGEFVGKLDFNTNFGCQNYPYKNWLLKADPNHSNIFWLAGAYKNSLNQLRWGLFWSADHGETWTIAHDTPANTSGDYNFMNGFLDISTPVSVPYNSTLSSNQPKNGLGEFRDNAINNFCCVQGWGGDPVNTASGGMDYSYVDLSIQTLGGPLSFQRSFSSTPAAANLYTSPFFNGWTHNHEISLKFPNLDGNPSEPGTKQLLDQVWFKGSSTNQYLFTRQISAEGVETFTPYPGLTATLRKEVSSYCGGNACYILEDKDKNTYYFDAALEYTNLPNSSIWENTPEKLKYWRNAQGYGFDYAYNGQTGFLEQVVEPTSQRSLTFSYETASPFRLHEVHLNAGTQFQTVTFQYFLTDGKPNEFQVTGLTGTWKYLYDEKQRLASIKDPSDTTVLTNEYNEEGQIFRQKDAKGDLIAKFAYTGTISTLSSSENGPASVHHYASNSTNSGVKDVFGQVLQKSFDQNFRLDSVTDPLNHTETVVWSADGARPTNITNALSQTTTLTYSQDGFHNLTQVITPESTTDYAYYPETKLVHFVKKQTGDRQLVTTYEYTQSAPQGLLWKVTDPEGMITIYDYYPAGEIWKVTQAGKTPSDLSDDLVTEYRYDDFGRVVSVITPDQKKGWTCYDTAGRVVRTVQTLDLSTASPCELSLGQIPLDDQVTDTRYDAAGNAIATLVPTVQNPAGMITRTYYDANSRPVFVVQNLKFSGISDPEQAILETLPPEVSLRGVEENITTQTIYDSRGRTIATVNQGGTITRTYYDEADRPVFVTRNLAGAQVTGPLEVEGKTIGITIDQAAAAPPTYNPLFPDQNVSEQTIYDAGGNAVLSVPITETCAPLASGPLTLESTSGISIPGNNQCVITRTYYDALDRPVAVVQNLIDLDIRYNDPIPERASNPALSDQNLRTDTIYDTEGNVIATIDPNGVITRTYYDALNRPEFVVQNIPQADYDNIAYQDTPPFENITTSTNITTQTVYDDEGKGIASIFFGIDPENPSNICQVTKDISGTVVTVNYNPYCIVTRNYYDASGRPSVTIQNLTGQTIQYGPGAPSVTPPDYIAPDKNVPSATTIYDTQGRAIAQATPDPLNLQNQRITRMYFDDWGRQRFGVRNLTNWDVHDDDPPPAPIYHPNTPDQNVPTAETRYDQDGRAIASIDANGTITRTYYDAFGRGSKVTRNLKDPSNPNATVEQRLQLASPPPYDNTDPEHADWNVTTETIYDAAGRAIATIDPHAVITRTYYDALGRPFALVQNYTGQDIPSASLPSNSDSNPDNDLTDENNWITYTIYNASGQVIATIDPHPSCAVQYAANGSWSIGESCTIHRTYYDDLGRVETKVRNLTGQSYTSNTPPVRETRQQAAPFYLHADQNIRTDYSFDSNGNRTDTTDPNGVVTHFVYDPLGRLTDVYENYLPGQTPSVEVNVHTEYTYDERGNRTTIRNAKAVLAGTADITRFSYDKLNRITAERDPLNHGSDYGYNVLGARSSQTDALGAQTSFHYDGLDRLVTIDYPAPDADVQFGYGPTDWRLTLLDGVGTTSWTYTALGQVKSVVDPYSKEVAYQYDGLGNRTKLIYPDQKTVMYGYDKLNRLKTVTDWDSQETHYTYTFPPGSSVRQILRPNFVVSSYTMNTVGRWMAIDHTRGESALANYHYAYDPAGNRIQATEDIVDALPNNPNRSHLIDYAYDPLHRLTEANYSDGAYYHYDYDAVGNRLAETIPLGATTYQYDDANRLESVGGVNYTWDDNGNLTNDGTHKYGYDRANRLKTVTDQADVPLATYTYNGLGDRLTENDTQFVLDLNAGLTQVLQDGAYTYLYGSERLMQQSQTSTGYFLGDALSSVRQLVDENGSVTLTKSYEPYGGLASSSGLSATTAFGFTNEYTSSTIKLINLRSRLYSTEMGRFLTRDTWQGDYTTPVTFNAWLYGNSDPINFFDPTGHRATNQRECLAIPQNSAHNSDYLNSCDALKWVDAHSSTIQASAFRHGVPPELVGGILASEIDFDTDRTDYIVDDLARAAFNILDMCDNVGVLYPDAGPSVLGASKYLYDFYMKYEMGVGVAQFHFPSWQIITQKYQHDFGDILASGGNVVSTEYEWTKILLTDAGAIEAVGIYSRFLADFRKGNGGEPNLSDHSSDLSFDDMAHIFTAYRAGIGGLTAPDNSGGYLNIGVFQQSQSLLANGELSRPYFVYLNSYFWVKKNRL